MFILRPAISNYIHLLHLLHVSLKLNEMPAYVIRHRRRLGQSARSQKNDMKKKPAADRNVGSSLHQILFPPRRRDSGCQNGEAACLAAGHCFSQSE